MTDQPNRPPLRSLLLILFGPIAWAVQFLVMYGAQSSMCAFDTGIAGGGPSALRLILIAATLVTALACLSLVVRPGTMFRLVTGRDIKGEPDRFVTSLARLLAALSGFAILLAGLVMLLLPLCDGLR